jgi:hypothetical protein
VRRRLKILPAKLGLLSSTMEWLQNRRRILPEDGDLLPQVDARSPVEFHCELDIPGGEGAADLAE